MPRRVWGNTLKQVTKDSEERKRRAVIDFVRFMPLKILATSRDLCFVIKSLIPKSIMMRT